MRQFWTSVYNTFFPVFLLIVRLVSLFLPKVKATLDGRRHLFADLEAKLKQLPQDHHPRLWIHASSVGEFEQARPVIAAYRKHAPDAFVAVTFLSVSGYEAKKNSPDTNLVCYLPVDTPANATRFVSMLRPDVLILMRYDFWLNHLLEARCQGATLILASAVLAPNAAYLRPVIKSFYRVIFTLFDKVFTLTEADAVRYRASFGLKDVEVGGDPRFDQVVQRSRNRAKVQHLQKHYEGRKVLVAGSSWKIDESMILPAFKSVQAENDSLILVPHEIRNENILRLEDDLNRAGFTFEKISSLSASFTADKVLIIDQIGYLAELYSLASIAYIGGGFGVNVHNTLEAAVYGIPVIYGPNIKKSLEAKELAALGGATIVHNENDLQAILKKFFTDEKARKASGEIAGRYVAERTGATEKILEYLLALGLHHSSSLRR
ncbi:MAG: 3-deoxy-D-manno-octulosonic acid transferase [Chlorobiales bacterium]|nr:3-deoxy-D-manno-octulosonic acid transferase [Chlorobiales bacterium]